MVYGKNENFLFYPIKVFVSKLNRSRKIGGGFQSLNFHETVLRDELFGN